MRGFKYKKRYKYRKPREHREVESKNKIHFTKFLKREIFLSMITITLVLIALLGGSYAVFTTLEKADDYNIVKTGLFQIEYDDKGEGLGNIINLNGAFPESDSEGEQRDPYKFKITNTGTITARYTVKIHDDLEMIKEDNCGEKLLPKTAIKYKLDQNNPIILDTIQGSDYIIAEGYLKPKESRTYEIRMWIDEGAGNEVLGTHYHGKISIEGNQNPLPNPPELTDELIPVTIANDGTVTYADQNSQWYNYEEKKWANAVILVDNAKEKYQVGSKIEEEDIESYFVWIPRFKYRLFDLGNYDKLLTNTLPSKAKTIQIEFQTKDDPKEETEEVGKYYTHPAFTLGGKELSGFWIGKFKVGYNQSNNGETSITTTDWNTTSAQINEINENKIIIKPNVYSWRNIIVYNAFMNAYQYNRNLDSHMTKNIEWGAVAYLSHSDYGINDKININNNSDYLTGYSAAEGIEPKQGGTNDNITQKYNTERGYLASTTGNITGVYDMSGGGHEFVAAYMDGYGVENNNHIKSGFSAEELVTYEKYLDKYVTDNSDISYKNRKLGDATGEMGPFDQTHGSSWYGTHSFFLRPDTPWFGRSGDFYFPDISQFWFSCYHGNFSSSIMTFRLVLAP